MNFSLLDDSSTKQHDANEEKHIIFEGEGEKFVNSTDDDVTLRQFYRPGGNFRPSYNHRVNAPIRPGRFNNIAPPSPYRPKPFPGPSQAFNGEHICKLNYISIFTCKTFKCNLI